ncbi:MAG: STAS domain-containing protein [Magnetococcales bacterium]|nr:STAS domain-containing protein [Magnetococcales bacterium]
MQVTAEREGNKLTLSFSKAFNFHSRISFVEAYKNQPADLSFELDFRKTQTVDSSALGMLMIFREHAGGKDADITIVGCSPELKKLFEIAQFQSIFNFV